MHSTKSNTEWFQSFFKKGLVGDELKLFEQKLIKDSIFKEEFEEFQLINTVFFSKDVLETESIFKEVRSEVIKTRKIRNWLGLTALAILTITTSSYLYIKNTDVNQRDTTPSNTKPIKIESNSTVTKKIIIDNHDD